MSPLANIFGIISNSIVLYVLIKTANKNSQQKNQEEFKTKQYSYIKIYSCLNIVISILQLISLINKCQQPFGIFCSPIRTNVIVQYFHMILNEFFKHFFVSVANFTYIGFALNRLSLVGSDHNRLTRFVSDLAIFKYMTFTLIFSTAISVIKPLRYEINRSFYLGHQTYPILFVHDYEIREKSSLGFLFRFLFNVIYDLINFFLFVIFNLIIDLMLLAKIRQVCREREARLADQSEACKEKIKQANENSIHEVISFVVTSMLSNFSLKLILCLITLNDFRILVANFTFLRKMRFLVETNWTSFPYNMKYFCHLEKSCENLQNLGEFLFFLSLSTNFFLMKRFDRNFKDAFQKIFKKNRNSNVL